MNFFVLALCLILNCLSCLIAIKQLSSLKVILWIGFVLISTSIVRLLINDDEHNFHIIIGSSQMLPITLSLLKLAKFILVKGFNIAKYYKESVLLFNISIFIGTFVLLLCLIDILLFIYVL